MLLMKTYCLLGNLMLLVCLGCKSSPSIEIDSTCEQLFVAVQMAKIAIRRTNQSFVGST